MDVLLFRNIEIIILFFNKTRHYTIYIIYLNLYLTAVLVLI